MPENALTSICLTTAGVALGAVANIVVSQKTNYHKKILYGFAITIIIVSLIFGWLLFDTLFSEEDGYPGYYLFGTLLSGISLFIATYKLDTPGRIYKTEELDPVVNGFTSAADKDWIRLFAGDLDFFGATPTDMAQNAQYTCLINENFRSIEIICKPPQNDKEIVRYGKILDDCKDVKFCFYQPDEADLRIRGRYKSLNGVARFLVYYKVESRRYEAIEMDLAMNQGASYEKTWNLIWRLGRKPTQDELQGYLKKYKAYV